MNDISATPASTPNPNYALGHSDSELERLATQARVIDPITRRFFQEAGVKPGMRVLDVGSGVGDVAFLAAELVGASGEVVGIDRASNALAIARTRAEARSLHQVSFIEGDLSEMTFEQPFDAIVGRYVLQFIPDPAAALRKLVSYLRPNGVIVFHELDWSGIRSWPAAPTYDQCCQWCIEALQRHGTEAHMGSKLYPTFVSAGLPTPTLRLEAVIAGGENASDRLFLAAELSRTLLPIMERLGVATADTVNIETLAARMQSEVIANGSTIVGHWQIGAWSRINTP